MTHARPKINHHALVIRLGAPSQISLMAGGTTTERRIANNLTYSRISWTMEAF